MTLVTMLACSAAILPAGAAADPCDDSFTQCDGHLVVPLESHAIFTIAPVKETGLDLYRRRLPSGWGMPAEPRVAIYLLDLDSPANVDGNPDGEYSSWREGTIALRAKHGDEEGWYELAMPVTSRFEFDIGRAAGFPKYMADGDAFAPAGDGWLAETFVDRQSTMRLEWQPGPGAPSDELRALAHQKEAFYTMVPVHDHAGQMHRNRFILKPFVPVWELIGGPPHEAAAVAPATALSEPEAGTVTFAVDPDIDRLDEQSPEPMPDLFAEGESLANLIDVQGTLPGVMRRGHQWLFLGGEDVESSE